MGRVVALVVVVMSGCSAIFGLHEPELAGDATPADGADAPDAAGSDAPLRYHATAVHFDGSSYLTANMLANTQGSPRGTFSVWLHFNGGDAAPQDLVIAQVVGTGGITRTASNQIEVVLRSCNAPTLLAMTTAGTYTSTSGWIHVLAAWDVSAGKAQLYVDDVADRAASPTIVSGDICYAAFRWGIGGLTSGELQADVADLYAALGTYIDLDVEANRRMFRAADGKPVDLGTGCAGPTGSPPTGCFTGKVLGWNTNKGTGGGFTVAGDALTAAPTSPSD
jgi:hypothetical protein